MEEQSGKVRLVRCPKCENILPELADFSVYQCGGCGAILRAKNKSLVAGDLSEKSAEERIESVSQKSDNLPEEGVANANVIDASEADMKPDTMTQVQSALEKDEYRRADRYKYLAKDTLEKGTFGDVCDMNKYKKGLDDMDKRTELKEVKPLFESAGTSRVPEQYTNWRNVGRNEVDGIKNLMSNVKDARLLNSSYLHEGPSTYRPGLSYGYTEQAKFNSNPEAANKVEYLEQDRAELLRKLDELKDQLSRSCDIADKPKENASLDRKSGSQQSYGNPKNWSLGGSSMPNRDSMQFPMPRERITDPPCLNSYPEPCTYPHRQEMAMPNIFPSVRDPNPFHMYGDPYESHLHQRPMHQVPGHYNETSRPFVSGQYMDNELKPFEPHPYNSAFHHPSCTCFHCYSTRQYVPRPLPSATFNDRRFQDVANDPVFYHRENYPPYTSYAFNPPPLSSQSALPLMRGTSDLNSEEGSLLQTRPQRLFVASGRVRCYPVAGGAPFITCCNCFELLHLPEGILNINKNQHSLRCGACSSIITYAVIDKKLVLSVDEEKRQISDEDNDSSSGMVRGKKSTFHGRMNRGGVSCSFNDYDNTGYEFESLDREPVLVSSGNVSNSSKQQDMQSYDSSSPSTSDNENSHDALVPTKEHSPEQPVKASPSPPPAGSPLQEYIDYSDYNKGVSRFGKGNQSSRSDHENLVLNKPTTRQNSVKEAAVATEMDVSYNEFSNTGVSRDSGDGSREYNPRRVNKGSDSFLTNLIKKSFSRSNQPGENCKENVSINGHPISHRVVKKAEKFAGPIRPGHYWYDARAGFWGVMGGPCLGIIPPSIEEFNFHMPEDCAGGDTGVYVNGRELHKKDLDLLVSRGLPTERDKCYIIDISGRVWDEDTKEELDCLGRLAPTVEKVKHGFGMKAPRTSA